MPPQIEKICTFLSLLPTGPKFCHGDVCYKATLLVCEAALDILGLLFWKLSTTKSFSHPHVSPSKEGEVVHDRSVQCVWMVARVPGPAASSCTYAHHK